MSEWLFWLVLLAIALFLWWLAYYATKRMYVNKRKARKSETGRGGDATLRKTDEPSNMEES